MKLSKILLVFILLIGIIAILSLSCPYFAYADDPPIEPEVPEIPPALILPSLVGLGAAAIYIRRFLKK